MKLLLDTNVLIPLEPGTLKDLEPGSARSADLFRTAQQVGAKLYVHPIQRRDIEADKNVERRQLRLALFEKYALLPSPPEPTTALLAQLGNPQPNTNDWVDAHLIAALQRSLVNALVTEDDGIHRRCRRLCLDSRCQTVEQALEILQDELPARPIPPPAIQSVYAHELDETDPIFDSFRADYPSFDKWLEKCRVQHRQCWTINQNDRKGYAGVCIVNPEDRTWADAHNPTLKICTFKIGEDATGFKFGELMLRALFDYAKANDYATLFVETFKKQAALIHVFSCFGFQQSGGNALGSEEIELRKRCIPWGDVSHLDPLEFHIEFGPHQIKLDGTSIYLVPIEPRFHTRLFPELEEQRLFWPGSEACGNSIRKAYLCNAQTTQIKPGDVLLFYRSHDHHAVTAVGVVEDLLLTDDPDELQRFASKRTVYDQAEIQEKTAHGKALGLLFRHSPVLKANISLNALRKSGLVSAAPRSIVKLKPEANSWIRDHLK